MQNDGRVVPCRAESWWDCAFIPYLRRTTPDGAPGWLCGNHPSSWGHPAADPRTRAALPPRARDGRGGAICETSAAHCGDGEQASIPTQEVPPGPRSALGGRRFTRHQPHGHRFRSVCRMRRGNSACRCNSAQNPAGRKLFCKACMEEELPAEADDGAESDAD